MNHTELLDYATVCNTILPKSFDNLKQWVLDWQEDRACHSDIDHIPPDVQRALASDFTLWSQYCDIFLRIVTHLRAGRSPTSRNINLALEKEFIAVGGSSKFALDYLLDIIQRVGHRSSHVEGFESRPPCPNDFTYTTMRKRLLDD